MDSARAAAMSSSLEGTIIGGWLVGEFLGHGKSAIVLDAEKDGAKAAIKIFDPDLVERFGKAKQISRIERERSLIGIHHENLVKIYDGGECRLTGHLFVVMELISLIPLNRVYKEIPDGCIPGIIRQLARAAKFLEDLEVVHRDIKPENIAISNDFEKIILMDLGVMRPFCDTEVSDEDARVFMGTLRYSSPEFLIRKEEQTTEGYRAITFYQIGAVLHDLIMKKIIFEESSSPYMILGLAVMQENPLIQSNDVDYALVDLARSCLVKNPEARLRAVSWERFEIIESGVNKARVARERVKRRSLISHSGDKLGWPLPPDSSVILEEATRRIAGIINGTCAGNEDFPRMQMESLSEERDRVRMWLERDDKLLLDRCLTADLRVEVVDESTRIISVYGKVGLVPAMRDINSSADDQPIFLGPLESEGLEDSIKGFLYISLDKGQEFFGHRPLAAMNLIIDLK